MSMTEKQANPVLVEVTRGSIVESYHRGAAVIVDIQGQVKAAWGDIHSLIYPRSAIKALQALPLVETGAAEAFGFTDEELALVCASHSGEERHIEVARSMLDKLKLTVADLECGSHWPMNKKASGTLSQLGQKPTPLHNNCSGKHLGMMAVARHLALPVKGYSHVTHPVQQRILGTLEAMYGLNLRAMPRERDGCSVPTWAVPLENLAYAFARFGGPDDLPETRAAACHCLRRAVFANPFMAAGTGRYCTEVMQQLTHRAFVKLGAEGVYIAALPDYGLGIALKCDDGATRASEYMMTMLLQYVGAIEDTDQATLRPWLLPMLKNRNGYEVGVIRAAAGFRIE